MMAHHRCALLGTVMADCSPSPRSERGQTAATRACPRTSRSADFDTHDAALYGGSAAAYEGSATIDAIYGGGAAVSCCFERRCCRLWRRCGVYG
eukprot:2883886-Rhodomonas_salina.1